MNIILKRTISWIGTYQLFDMCWFRDLEVQQIKTYKHIQIVKFGSTKARLGINDTNRHETFQFHTMVSNTLKPTNVEKLISWRNAADCALQNDIHIIFLKFRELNN